MGALCATSCVFIIQTMARPFSLLSPREKQLLRRLAQGKADKKIALGISGTTAQDCQGAHGD